MPQSTCDFQSPSATAPCPSDCAMPAAPLEGLTLYGSQPDSLVKMKSSAPNWSPQPRALRTDWAYPFAPPAGVPLSPSQRPPEPAPTPSPGPSPPMWYCRGKLAVFCAPGPATIGVWPASNGRPPYRPTMCDGLTPMVYVPPG